MNRKWVAIAAAYVAGLFLTFGYNYANFSCSRSPSTSYMCGTDHAFGAVGSAILWPIYWTGYGSIRLFD